MASYPTFDDAKVQAAIQTAQAHNSAEGLAATDTSAPNLLAGGEFSVAAECVSVTVENGQVCLQLPLGIGGICLPVPGWVPSGSAAQACLDICTTWGIPTGVRVTVSVAGQQIISKVFGKC